MPTNTDSVPIDLHAIQFAQSKNKMLGIVAALFPTFYGAIKILKDGPAKINQLFPGAAFLLIPIAVLAIGFFLWLLVYVYNKLRDSTPGLIVSDEGITDHSSAVDAGFIPWSDVEEISEGSFLGSHYMRIKVRNIDQYINKQPSALKRFMMRHNHKTFKAGLVISAGSIRCSFEELKDLLERRFRAYRDAQGQG
ncbi:MAG: hypothetical protein JNM22_11530 [Saprospiraceae bacterium]|nr:hypothetical protein [Saprospiraceae bacterium]